MIPINAPQIGREEIEAVVKVLESCVLTSGLGSGPKVREFEDAFSDFVKAKHAVAVNSGTAALHLALLASGVSKGDEVIVPSFTFTATAETVVLAGGKPVFVDIDPNTYCVDPEEVEKAITEKTKVIIPVDLYGFPAEMEVLREIADKHGLAIVEDAAQAHGAAYKGKPPGCLADAACWSFYGSKNMTTGEGGMVTTNNDELAEKLRCIRSHGEKEKYVSVTLGHNYRMPEIEAAIGCVQLRKLPTFIEKRRRNAEQLTDKLRENDALQLPFEDKNHRHSWYLYTVRMKEADVKSRNRLVEELNKAGIGAAVYYPVPIHSMPYYRQFCDRRLPRTEEASHQVFSLPVHPGVSPQQIDYIASSVLKLLENFHRS